MDYWMIWTQTALYCNFDSRGSGEINVLSKDSDMFSRAFSSVSEFFPAILLKVFSCDAAVFSADTMKEFCCATCFRNSYYFSRIDESLTNVDVFRTILGVLRLQHQEIREWVPALSMVWHDTYFYPRAYFFTDCVNIPFQKRHSLAE